MGFPKSFHDHNLLLPHYCKFAEFAISFQDRCFSVLLPTCKAILHFRRIQVINNVAESYFRRSNFNGIDPSIHLAGISLTHVEMNYQLSSCEAPKASQTAAVSFLKRVCIARTVLYSFSREPDVVIRLDILLRIRHNIAVKIRCHHISGSFSFIFFVINGVIEQVAGSL